MSFCVPLPCHDVADPHTDDEDDDEADMAATVQITFIGPPRGGPMLYAIWLFYGFAICYNQIFNTAINKFSISAIKNVMVPYAIKMYTKNI